MQVRSWLTVTSCFGRFYAMCRRITNNQSYLLIFSFRLIHQRHAKNVKMRKVSNILMFGSSPKREWLIDSFWFESKARKWLLLTPAGWHCLSQQYASVSQGRICSDNYSLPHLDRSCRSNFLPHPVTVYWHRADQPQRWPYIARRLAG